MNKEFQSAIKTAQTAIREATRRDFVGPRRDNRLIHSLGRQPFRMQDIKPKQEMVLVANPAAPGGVMPMTRQQAQRTGMPIIAPIR